LYYIKYAVFQQFSQVHKQYINGNTLTDQKAIAYIATEQRARCNKCGILHTFCISLVLWPLNCPSCNWRHLITIWYLQAFVSSLDCVFVLHILMGYPFENYIFHSDFDDCSLHFRFGHLSLNSTDDPYYNTTLRNTGI
jgi:hypothetical protein